MLQTFGTIVVVLGAFDLLGDNFDTKKALIKISVGAAIVCLGIIAKRYGDDD